MQSVAYSTCVEAFRKISENRGPSHNLDHVIAVCDTAKKLLDSRVDMEKLDALCITHDYSDHKYDHNGLLLIHHRKLLESLFPTDTSDLLMKTIKLASYSTERKLREEQLRKKGLVLLPFEQVDWLNPGEYLEQRKPVLDERVEWDLPKEYILLRDLLSDADKARLRLLGGAAGVAVGRGKSRHLFEKCGAKCRP